MRVLGQAADDRVERGQVVAGLGEQPGVLCSSFGSDSAPDAMPVLGLREGGQRPSAGELKRERVVAVGL